MGLDSSDLGSLPTAVLYVLLVAACPFLTIWVGRRIDLIRVHDAWKRFWAANPQQHTPAKRPPLRRILRVCVAVFFGGLGTWLLLAVAWNLIVLVHGLLLGWVLLALCAAGGTAVGLGVLRRRRDQRVALAGVALLLGAVVTATVVAHQLEAGPAATAPAASRPALPGQSSGAATAATPGASPTATAPPDTRVLSVAGSRYTVADTGGICVQGEPLTPDEVAIGLGDEATVTHADGTTAEVSDVTLLEPCADLARGTQELGKVAPSDFASLDGESLPGTDQVTVQVIAHLTDTDGAGWVLVWHKQDGTIYTGLVRAQRFVPAT